MSYQARQTMTKLTIDDLIAELDEARHIAKENGNPTAMISATMSKAKIYGLDNGIESTEQKEIRSIMVQVQDARKPVS